MFWDFVEILESKWFMWDKKICEVDWALISNIIIVLPPHQGVSAWLPWWEELHPTQDGDLGHPSPLLCSQELQTERVFIKNTFDGFYKTGLDQYLRYLISIIFLFEKQFQWEERQNSGGDGPHNQGMCPQHHHVGLQLGVNLEYILFAGLDRIFSYRVLLLGDCCGDRSVEVCCLEWNVCLTSICQVHQQILSTYDGYNCRVMESPQFLNMKVI